MDRFLVCGYGFRGFGEVVEGRGSSLEVEWVGGWLWGSGKGGK